MNGGNRDLAALLSMLQESVSWQNAPKPSCLSHYSPLYSMLVALSPQGLLPAKNLALAIVGAHKARPVNYTGQTREVC